MTSMPPENAPALSVSSHENKITIDDSASKTIKSITYVNGSLQITAGQPSSVPPAIPTPKNNVWEITLQAGRKKSAPVANSFNSVCGGKSKEYAPSGGGGGTPDELNFYFAVTIGFTTGGSATIYLGQGNYGTTNNWWIGGSPIFSAAKPRLEYQAGGKIVTNEIGGDHKTFKFKQTDVRPFSPIQNVFVLMLENHSFDNMLALSGIPGIRAATSKDCNSYTDKSGNKQTVCFAPNAPDSMPTDPGHEFLDVFEQLTGLRTPYPRWGNYPAINNSGFAENYATSDTEKTGLPKDKEQVHDIIRGFEAGGVSALAQLAKSYVVCDQWFSSLPGPTWPNRFFIHAASSNGLDHSPSDTDIIGYVADGGFHFPHGTIFDQMTKHGITWRLFQDSGNPIGAVPLVSFLKGILFHQHVRDLTTFAKEVNAPAPNLYPYQYTFIEPNYGDFELGTYRGGSSQHPMDSVASGDALIAWVYDTLSSSPIWKQSVLIITYDEHGGFYDHYPPPPAPSPNDGGTHSKNNDNGFTFEQYGVRVPAVIVSPFIPRPGVDHTHYDHTSVLATLEYLFGLPNLTDRDKKAARLDHLFSTTPREDIPKLEPSAAPPPARTPLSAEEEAALALEPVPNRSTTMGMLGVLFKADSEISGFAPALARFEAVKTRADARIYAREVMAKVQAARAAQASIGDGPTPSAAPSSD
jgi:phospholipase C